MMGLWFSEGELSWICRVLIDVVNVLRCWIFMCPLLYQVLILCCISNMLLILDSVY